ncbi:hypothetical protein ABH927_005948 [Planotetraspora sp. GP83]
MPFGDVPVVAGLHRQAGRIERFPRLHGRQAVAWPMYAVVPAARARSAAASWAIR